MPLEAQIQAWLAHEVDAGTIGQRICDGDLTTAPDVDLGKHFAADFPIDTLIRTRAIASARRVLRELQGTLTVVSATSNIALRPDHRLLPDLIVVNEETGCVLVIEIKRSKDTEREAVTELLGYEQEIRNHLPFLADHDLCFVIVTTEFSPLLDHAVGTMLMWDSRHVACLRLHAEPDNWSLSVVLPSGWTSLGQTGIPPDAFSTLTLAMYPTGFADTNGGPASVLKDRLCVTALELIAREGDRTRSSGFALIWRDFAVGVADTFITIAVVKPLWFLPNSVALGMIGEARTTFARFVLETAARMRGLDGPPSLFEITRRARHLLSRVADPQIEAVRDWSDSEAEIRARARPLAVEFWGVLGDYVREYITTPVVRDKLMPDLDRHGLDWRDPRIALGLLADVMGTAPFHDGCFRASGFFDLGVCVGTINILCETMERQAASMGERELAMLWWAELDLIAAARQISWRYMAARDLTRKPPRLRLGAELDVAARKESVRQFGTWIGEEFIGDRSPLCRWCFAVGANQATYWNEALRGRFSQEDQAEFLAAATQSTRELTSLLLEGIASHDERAALETKLAAALHLERFPQTGEFAATAEASSPQCMRGGEGLLSLADEIALELHHDLAAPDWRHADWAWLKTQVQDMASAGQDNVAIFVAPDGRLGTGLLTMPIPRKADYKREVPIVDERSALAIVRWVTWDDALAGRFPE